MLDINNLKIKSMEGNDEILWKCELPMRKGEFDDDYVFYKNGKIEHQYDKNKKFEGLNLCEIILPEMISENTKLKILERCPAELKEAIEKLLKG